MKDFQRDLWYALRLFAKSPGFTICVVLTLALGIGVNSAIFSVVRGVLLRPLPYSHGEGLLHLGQQPPASTLDNVSFSVAELHDLAAQSRTLSGLAEYHSMPFTLLGHGEPAQAKIGVVSANFFEVFGVHVLHGRTFLPADEAHGAEPVLVLTYGYWRRLYGGDVGILGRRLRLNNNPIKIIGVLPPLPSFPGEDDAFMPTVACQLRSSEMFIQNRKARLLTAFAHLRPGVTLKEAKTELALISSRMRQENPGDYDPDKPSGIPVLSVREQIVGNFRSLLLLLFGIVGMVLLVACANVANFILARLSRREHELGVRVALGAGRGRLARQLLTEALVLSSAGAALGLLLAAFCVRLLAAFAARFTARTDQIGIDAIVLLFTAGLAVATGLIIGVAPALRASPSRLAEALRTGTLRAGQTSASLRIRGAMVIAQVAVSFVLLVGAGLLLRTLHNLESVDPGFKSAGVVVTEVALPLERYPKRAQRLDFFDRLLTSVRAIKGVQFASLSAGVPLSEVVDREVTIEGRPQGSREQSQATFHVAGEDYFRLLGVPLLEGRVFTSADTVDAMPVALVNRSMQRRYWPNASPLGKRFSIASQGPAKLWTVVGVVADVKQAGLTAESGPAFYLPFSQFPNVGDVFVRTDQDPRSLLDHLPAMVHAIDPEVPVLNPRTLEQIRAESIAPSRLTAILVGLFAALAVVIAALGVGSVVAFAVAERTQEIGIRTALGATSREIQALILRRSLPLLAVGLALGALGSLWLTRLISGLLFGVAPHDPLTFAAVASGFTAVFVCAALIPARRAAKIDPLLALRSS